MKKALILFLMLFLMFSLCSIAYAQQNVAQGKNATQSSTGYDAPASRAVDGNTDGAFWNGSVSHTNAESCPWWQVDLGASYYIDSLLINNRTDCCGERLGDYYVFVSNEPFSTNDVNALAKQSNVSSFYNAGPNYQQNQFSINQNGRYVRIQLTKNEYLSLAEVEVLASGGASTTGGTTSGTTNGQASLRLDKTLFTPGEKINVYFTAPASFPGDAWVGIIPSNVPHGNEAVNDQYDLTYQYVNKLTSGTMIFNAPTQPGSYDFRMHDTDSNGKEVDSVTFTVSTTGGTTNGQASLVATPAKINFGGNITVSYSGAPGYEKDWIGIYKADSPDRGWISWKYLNGNKRGTLDFTAPQEDGTYNFRMFENDGYKLLATSNSIVIGQETKPATGVLRAAPGNGKVYLEWNASSEPYVTGYHLFRGTSPGGETSTPITDFPVVGTSYADPNVDNGVKYCYIMRPVYNNGNMGPVSNEACAIPLGSGSSGGGYSGGIQIILQINNPYMTVNGISREIDPGRGTVPVIVNGRTLLPIRSVIETIGGIVSWNEAESKVTIQVKGTTIELWINNKTTRVNGANKITDVAPQTINDRTMMPLRFIAENLGADVKWDGENYTATLNFKP